MADGVARVRRVLRHRDAAPPDPSPSSSGSEEEEADAGRASPPINVKRRREAAGGGRAASASAEVEAEYDAPRISAGVTDEDLRRVAAEIDARANAARELLDRIHNPPAQVHLDRMVRAVMRTMLFRAGRKPGAPVRRADLIAAVDAAHTSAAAVAGPRHHAATSLALVLAREKFARDLCLDLARVDLIPVGRSGGGSGGRGGSGGGGGGTGQEAFCLRTLLPPPAAAVAAAAGGAGTRPPLAPGLGLLAAALVRLGGTPASGGPGGGGGGARGPGDAGSGGPGWMEESELWSLLGDLGARRPSDGPGALEAAWAGLGGSAASPPGNEPALVIIPGVGDPAAALKAATEGRWLVERWGPPLEPGAGSERARWYGVGETALGGDGGARLDAFIRLLFEAPDPAAELAGGGRARGE